MKGAYIVVMGIPKEVTLDISRKRFVIKPGRYAYVGSAMGPGGIEARGGRHIGHIEKSRAPGGSKGIARHWHIDYLFPSIGEFSIVAAESEERAECRFVRELKSMGALPVEGFGSTDCRERCGGHLLLLNEVTESSALATSRKAFVRLGLKPFRMH